MKKLLLTLLALAMCGMAAQAKNYEINVGGVEVSSSNCDNVTGKDITVTEGCSSGYVRYIESSNRLILNNITIHRTGSGDYAIHNRKCDDLLIEFYGKCYFTSDKAAALKLQRNTTISPQNYSETKIYGCFDNDTYAIDIADKELNISGSESATLTVESGNTSYGCIYRTTGCVNIKGNTKIKFRNDPSGYPSFAPALRNVYMNFYHGSDVHVWGVDYAIYDCYIHTHYDDVEVLIPYGGDYSHAEHVYLSSHYVAIINEENFPDANFRSYLMSSTGGGYANGFLKEADIESRTSFDYLYGKRISNLKGIEYFTNLTSLNCSDNFLTTLNVSALTKLETLTCSKNDLGSLTFPKSLKKLDCYDNHLSSLNLSGCTQLSWIDCGDNYFTTLEISGMPSLSYLYCKDNDYLISLKSQNNPNLFSIVADNCTALKELYCDNNKLSTLKLTGCSKLNTLDCSSNNLSGTFSLGDFTSLKTLKCNNNKITSLSGISKSITSLDCAYNNISSLSLIGCSALTHLDCSNNKFTGLSVKDCSALTYLDCSNNYIAAPAMATLINSMRTIPASSSKGQFYVRGSVDAYGGGNVIHRTQVMKAKKKNWIPYMYYTPRERWVEIGDSVEGDVNDDFKVNVSDVTVLINMIMGLTPMDESAADVNGDGYVNVSDVSALINLILGVS